MERHLSAGAVRRGLLQSVSPVGIFRTDAAGRCLSVDARWCEITGLAPAEALGEGWARALHPDDRERVLEEWSRSAREERAFESNYRFRRPDGAVTPVLGQGLPERDARGGITGFIGTITDLTRHVQLVSRCVQCEANLNLRNEQLRRLALDLTLAQERERRRIAKGLHDEVGQILAAAMAKSGQLLETGARADVPARAGEIRALLDRAIGETRSLTFELSSPVLYELGLVAATESFCEQLAKGSGVQFRVAADAEPEPLGEDLRVLLYRAVRELCLNVVKHARAARAEVRLQAEGDRLRIVVADDGQGFDVSEDAPRFGPDGGAGLFSLRELSAQIGGSFEIESSPGKGTRALLTAPLG